MRERLRRGLEALFWFFPALTTMLFVYRDLHNPRGREPGVRLSTVWSGRLERCLEYSGSSERVLLVLFVAIVAAGVIATAFFSFTHRSADE